MISMELCKCEIYITPCQYYFGKLNGYLQGKIASASTIADVSVNVTHFSFF